MEKERREEGREGGRDEVSLLFGLELPHLSWMMQQRRGPYPVIESKRQGGQLMSSRARSSRLKRESERRRREGAYIETTGNESIAFLRAVSSDSRLSTQTSCILPADVMVLCERGRRC